MRVVILRYSLGEVWSDLIRCIVVLIVAAADDGHISTFSNPEAGERCTKQLVKSPEDNNGFK